MDVTDFKPGMVLRWPSEEDIYAGMVAIVGSHEIPSTDAVPLMCWKQRGMEWVCHKIGHTSYWESATILDGDEADRIHAEYAAAVLMDEVTYSGWKD